MTQLYKSLIALCVSYLDSHIILQLVKDENFINIIDILQYGNFFELTFYKLAIMEEDLKYLQNIKSLKLINAYHITDYGLRFLSNIKSLYLCGCNITDYGLSLLETCEIYIHT